MNAFIPVYLTKVLFDTPLFRTEEQVWSWMGRFTLDCSNCVFAQLQIWIFYGVSKIISHMLHVWNIYQHLPSFTP